MASLGTFLLLASFVIGAYAAVASVVGARRRSRKLIESGTGAFYLVAALMSVASAVILDAFVTGDYTIKYVVQETDSVQPLFYKIASYWGGLNGSIMFWVFLLSIFGSIAVYINRERHRELIPYVVAVISVVEMFFLYLMIVHKNPFTTYLTAAPADGQGMNPLLQDPYMAIHPPSMYTGFVGMTIPYAFGMAALFTGYLDDIWMRAVRRWTMIAWLFLSFGLILGMIWAYEELGWGGFWGWDPVENAGLLPWLTGTAFLHSVMVQERRSMLRVWNMVLVIMTFFLTIFATFMTRSGVVQSVHAFGEDKQLAWLFTGFMITILVVSFGMLIYRLPLLRSRHELDSWASREAAFLVNNWILLFSAIFVLFATMFPTLSQAVTGQRLTVGPPFFNTWMLPIGLILLFLTGVGPLMAWRKSTLANLVQQFTWPVAAFVVVTGLVFGLGLRVWTSGLCFGLCAFVAATILQEFIRGARVRQTSTGTDLATAMIGIVSRNKRRYGGYIIHLGIALIFLGFAGQGFKQDKEVLLKVGQEATLGPYAVRNEGIVVTDDGAKQMVTGKMAVFENGKSIGMLYPARWFYRKHENEPTTEVAIRRGFAGDLYLVLPSYDLQTQSANLHIVINPLVDWIWFGFGILAFGTGIALLPEQAFAFALSRLPAETATTGLIVLLALGLSAGTARAQAVAPGDLTGQQAVLEHQLENEVMCMCGCRASVATCPDAPTCTHWNDERAHLAAYVKEGMTHDQVLAAMAKYYGQDVLLLPPDKGFNRLAWLFPYLLGAGGIVVVGTAAIRWSRRPADAPPAPVMDAKLNERLDDELRDLD
ncbi:MAG: cytochrome c biogenesis protein CcsA [Acidobacteriota bacterium]|nr:cytochrome c biogenesis protein CcsA [Acidobacteriota bacterium]